MKRFFWPPSPAAVIACVALFVALGGGAYAAAQITSQDVKNNSLLSKDLKDGKGVKGVDVTNNSLTGKDIKESSLGKVNSAAHADNATAAANADTLDGIHANGLVRAARTSSGATLALTTTPQTYGSVLSITAPAPGFVLVNSSVTIQNGDSCTTECFAIDQIRHIQTSALSNFAEAWAQRRGNLSNTWVFPVAAGVNTFDIQLSRAAGGDGTLNGWWQEMTAIYLPFGSTGAGALEATGARVGQLKQG